MGWRGFRQGGYVFIGVCLFVSWQDYAITTQPILIKFGGQAALWPRKKRLDLVVIHITLN